MLLQYNHGMERQKSKGREQKKKKQEIFTMDKWIESEHLQEIICILQKKFVLAFQQCNLSSVCPLLLAHPRYRNQNANKFYINSTWQNNRESI